MAPAGAAFLAAAALFNAVHLSAAGACEAGSQPLLWQVTRGTQKAFLMAGNNENLQEVEPLPESVVQAVSCADMTYFAMACTPGPEGGLGSFYEHCKEYPTTDRKDAIALRLKPDVVFKLQGAITDLIEHAPRECINEATDFKSVVQKLPSSNFRTSLRMVYIEATAVMDSSKCHVDPFSPGAHTAAGGGFEGWVREQMANTGRPVWGLLDIMDACRFISSTTLEEDAGLAWWMTQKFANATWRAQYQQHARDLAQAIKCGYEEKLSTMQDLLHTNVFGKYNPNLADRISDAMEDEPDKTLLFVLPATHFFDSGKVASLQRILSQAGFDVQRLGHDGLTCRKSDFIGSGAKELKLCLMPPGQRQPQTCVDFEDKVNSYLAENPKYGRVVEEGDCKECFAADEACVCDFQWSNLSSFNEMCASINIGGVTGEIWEVDMTRNPGSIHRGTGLSQKIVQASRMMCYAETCSIRLLEEHALRSWYSNEPELCVGLVTLVKPGTRGKSIVDLLGQWWFLVLFAIASLAVAACFALGFLAKHPRKPPKHFDVMLPPPEDDVHQHKSDGLWPPPISVFNGNLMREPFPGSEPPFLPDAERKKRPATAYDSSLLDSVMQARQDLADAGAQAVQNMQWQTLQGLRSQALNSGLFPSPKPGSVPFVPQSMGYAAAAGAPMATMGSYVAMPQEIGYAAAAGAIPATATLGSYAAMPGQWGYYPQSYLPPTSSATYDPLANGSHTYSGH